MPRRRPISPVALGLALVVLSLAIALAGCGGSSSSSNGSKAANASYLAAVTRAAYTTDQVPGYKFDIDVSAKLNGKSASFGGSGAISEKGSQGSLSMEVDGKSLTEIIDKPYVYIKVPSDSETSVTHGKPWIRANIDVFSDTLGGGSFSSSSADPTQTLNFLKSAGTVTRIGSEAVRGAPATHYHAVIDLARYASAAAPSERAAAKRYTESFTRISGSSTLPMDVWIDAQGRVSRMMFTLSICGPGGSRLRESLSMELYDYGSQQPVVQTPSSTEVTDITASLKAEVAKGLEQLSCH